jgi:hypothetical protein
LLIDWLAQIADDPFIHGANPVHVTRIGGYKNGRYSVPRVDKVAVEFEPGHRRHLDVGNQAPRFAEPRRCEELGCRRKYDNRIAERPHEPSQGLAKRPVIIDDRD